MREEKKKRYKHEGDGGQYWIYRIKPELFPRRHFIFVQKARKGYGRESGILKTQHGRGFEYFQLEKWYIFNELFL